MPNPAELTIGLTRFLLGLPPRRCRARLESAWLEMEDGVRLATRRLSPIDGRDAPVVLIRTPYGTSSELTRDMLLGRIIAEAGYHVVVQDVRGRWDSEGTFTPFANEARDGATTLAWISDQTWCGEGIGLVGSSYTGHAAWAALSAAPERVRALVVVMGASDIHPVFHPGGAFSLASALDWATRVGDRATTPRADIDLERGLRHRPVREADRVALRRIDWYRGWVDHPHRDDHWEELAARLPERPPPTLLIAGWYDFFLDAQLRDHATLVERADTAPRLVIGPWSHGRAAHPRWRGLKRGFLGVSLRETLDFLALHLAVPPAREAPRDGSPVLFFMGGGGEDTRAAFGGGGGGGGGEKQWKSSPAWPPPDAAPRSLYLRADQNAGTHDGGALSWHPPAEHEEPHCFEADPEDPVPSVGGAFFSSQLLGRANGARDQRCLNLRSDLVRFTGEVLERELAIAGRVRLVLHARSDAADADFTAKLVDVSPDGAALNLCEGIIRCRGDEPGASGRSADPETVQSLEIDLWACAWRFRPGHRIRLEVAAASFPRFDRNPGSGEGASPGDRTSAAAPRQTVLHDREHRSHLVLPVVGLPTADAVLAGRNAKGPPG